MIQDLTNHLWQSTLFAFVVGLLTTALRKNRAHVRYWLWFAASLKFLIPFSLLVGLGGHLRWVPIESEVTVPTVSAVSLAIAQVAQPFPVLFASGTATPRTAADWAQAVILGSWVCGFGAILLMRLRQWRRIRAAVRISMPLTIPRVGLQTLQIRSSPDLLEPGVVGLWRPVLLVPADVENRLAPAQLEAVLAHELCHARRHDNLTAAIHMLVEAVFWFHPLVWWIGARLVDERERACDEHVLRVFGHPLAYAEGILNVCKLCVESPLACVSGVTGSNVKKRIEDIMNNRIGVRLNFTRKTALALAAAVALAAPIFVGMMTAPLQAQSRKRASDPSALVRTKETVLKYALFQMRDAIDRYHTDKKQYPSSLARLVSEGYISQIPADPFTNRPDSWKTVPSKPDPNKAAAGLGIYDVMSGSEGTAMDGTKYATW